FDENRGVTVLFGGSVGGTSNSETWEWDGSMWVQRSTGNPPASISARMVYDHGRGVCVYFGGMSSSLPPPNGGDTWERNGTVWTPRAKRPPGRYAHAMAYSSESAVVTLFGGAAGFGGPYLGDTWLWNGRNWTDTAVAGPSPRGQHAMAYDAH